MPVKVTVKGDDLGGKLKQAVAFMKTHKVRVGIPDGGGSHGGISNVELAFILTNGSPINRNPPRPFLEPGINQPDVQEKIVRHMKAAAKAACEGDTSGAMAQLDMAGQAGEDGVKDYMISGSFPSNAPITIEGGWMRNRVSGKPVHVKGKGSSKPLIDTGNLQEAITHIIEGG